MPLAMCFTVIVPTSPFIQKQGYRVILTRATDRATLISLRKLRSTNPANKMVSRMDLDLLHEDDRNNLHEASMVTDNRPWEWVEAGEDSPHLCIPLFPRPAEVVLIVLEGDTPLTEYAS